MAGRGDRKTESIVGQWKQLRGCTFKCNSVKAEGAPCAYMYFTEAKLGCVQYNILATSIPSASQMQARPHHMITPRWTKGPEIQ